MLRRQMEFVVRLERRIGTQETRGVPSTSRQPRALCLLDDLQLLSHRTSSGPIQYIGSLNPTALQKARAREGRGSLCTLQGRTSICNRGYLHQTRNLQSKSQPGRLTSETLFSKHHSVPEEHLLHQKYKCRRQRGGSVNQ